MARHDPSKITCERRRPVKQVETDDFIVNDADNADLIWQSAIRSRSSAILSSNSACTSSRASVFE